MSRLPPLLALLAATLLLMAVAFADGRPTVFYDSHSYDVMGRDLIETIRDYPASTHNKFEHGRQMGDWPVPTDRLVDPNVEQARSWFYGVFLHGAHVTGTIWLLAAVQSFLAAYVIYLLWRTLAPQAPRWSYLALIAGATVGTSISFFTTFAMPDIFAGIGGAALILILTQGDRLRKLEIVALWAICAFAMMIHKSHWGTGIVMALGGGFLTWAMGLPLQAVVRRSLLILSAAVFAFTCNSVADGVYKSRTGYKLGHPPFVMARVLADGPGRAYMRYACGRGEDYALCRFQQNVGASTDLILWSDRKKLGVFNIADLKTRQKLEAQEMRFVIGTVKYDPVGQFSASMWNWAQQIVAFQVDDPLRNPAAYLRGRYWPTTMLPKLIPNFDACRTATGCRPPFKYEVLLGWHGAVLLVSIGLLLWRMAQKDVRQAVMTRGLRRGEEPARVTAAVLLVVAVLAVNAAICGMLSGPFARYQSRLVWLLPVGAGLTLCALPWGYASLVTLAMRLWRSVLNIWERLRAVPALGRFLPPLDGHFMRFCCVGGLGFIVDFTVLKAVVNLGANPLWGRWISFAFAVVATWLVNRAWTFAGHHDGPPRSLLKEFASYLAVQSTGFAANYAVFTGMILGIPALDGRLLPPLVAGTAAGLVINYLGAKHFVFRRKAGAS